ncbi:MAG: dihydrolipoamide acetyltransferase [Myxococcota bacterium]
MRRCHSAGSAAIWMTATLLTTGVAVAQDTQVEVDTDSEAADADDAPSPSGLQPPTNGTAGAPQDERAFDMKLRAIEDRVNDLKEKIFQSKARLVQLQEVVLHGTISGAKAVLIHKNEMGSSFLLTRVQYALDGAPIFNRVDSGQGELDQQEEIEIFNGSIAPGNHQVSVYLEYRGHGYGVFSYLKGYKFRIKSSYTFDAEEGKQTTVRIVGYEKGGMTTELKDRPSVRYDIETTKAQRTTPAAPQNAATNGAPVPAGAK